MPAGFELDHVTRLWDDTVRAFWVDVQSDSTGDMSCVLNSDSASNLRCLATASSASAKEDDVFLLRYQFQHRGKIASQTRTSMINES
jgi:hypothetical protein